MFFVAFVIIYIHACFEVSGPFYFKIYPFLIKFESINGPPNVYLIDLDTNFHEFTWQSIWSKIRSKIVNLHITNQLTDILHQVKVLFVNY